jgi:hypothetical protein
VPVKKPVSFRFRTSGLEKTLEKAPAEASNLEPDANLVTPWVNGWLMADRRLLFHRDDADLAPVRTVVFESHPARNFCEERVILAETDIEAGTKAATMLTDENRPPADEVAVVPFHTKALRVAVATVAGTPLSFFVSHIEPSAISFSYSPAAAISLGKAWWLKAGGCLKKDIRNPHTGELRTMSLRPAHSLSALLLEHANFRSAPRTFDDAHDAGIGQKRRAGVNCAAILLDHQYLNERDFLADLAGRAVDGDRCARAHFDLAACRLNDRVHHALPRTTQRSQYSNEPILL